jgi:hypothetical protein
MRTRSRRALSIGFTAGAAALPLALAAPAVGQFEPEWSARFTSAPDIVGDEAASVVTDAEGNVYVTGSTHTWSQINLANIVTIRYSPDGVQQWLVEYDGPSGNQDLGRGITLDAAGDLIVIGRSEGDFVVLKYDRTDGSLIWERRHDTGGTSQPNALTTDADGNIYVTGQSWASDQNDFYTVKMNSAGAVQWTARYNGPGAFLFAHDVANDIALDAGGDVVVTGSSNAPGSASEDYLTIKYRGADGQQLWLQRYSGAGANDVGNAVAIDGDGDVYVTGGSFQGFWKYVTIKYRGSDGGQLWLAVDSPELCNIATEIALGSDGEVYVSGRADPDCDESNFNENIATVKHRAADGAVVWTDSFGSPAVGAFDVPYDLILDAADNVYVTGENSGLLVLLHYDPATGDRLHVDTVDSGVNEIALGRALALDPAQDVIVTGMARNFNTENRDYFTLKYPAQASGTVADLDGDGVVGVNDFLELLAAWGPCGDCGQCPADLDGDCQVGVNDFLILLGQWG